MENTNQNYSENEFFTISDYIKIFKRQWYIILIVFAVIASAVIYNSKTTHPLYQASAVIMVKSNSSQAQVIFNQTQSTQQAINNQLAYLQSRQLAEEVVQKLMESEHADSLYILGTAGSIEPNFFAKIKAVPAKAVASVMSLLNKKNTSMDDSPVAQEKPSQQRDVMPDIQPIGRIAVNSLNVRSFPGTNAERTGNLEYGEIVDVLESRQNWLRVERLNGESGWVSREFVTLDTLTLPDVEENRESLSEERLRNLANRLRGSISISPVRSTDAINISATSPFAEEAALIANTVAETYYEQNLEIARSEASQIRDFVQSQLENVNAELLQAENELVEFQENSEAIALDQETSNLVSRISQFQSEYDNTQIEKEATQDRIEYLRGRLSDSEERSLNNLENVTTPYLQALQDTLARTQLQMTMMRTNPDIGENHPVIQSLENRVTEIRRELKSATQQMISQGVENMDPLNSSVEIFRQILEAQGQIVFLEIKEKQLSQLIEKYNSQLETLPEKTLEMARLQRDRQMKEELFLLLKTRLEETRITEAGQGGSVQIVDAAVVPRSPIRPNLQRDMMVGIILGIGFGLGVAFLRAMTDKSVHDSQDLEHMGYSVLGTIPSISANKDLKGLPKISRKLIHHQDVFGPAAEAYRIIRTNLHFINTEKQGRTLLVTSAAPGEGKSLTAANLAIVMARMGQKTVLVDADLRRPMLHQLFQSEFHPGTADVLLDKSGWDEAVLSTEIENLFMIPCGMFPASPTEVINAKNVGQFINRLTEHFENIILDSPPLMAVSDTSILSNFVENTVLVAKSKETNKDILKKASQHLKQVGGNFTGIILNEGDVKKVGYGGYYYDYKQKPPQNGVAKKGLKSFSKN